MDTVCLDDLEKKQYRNIHIQLDVRHVQKSLCTEALEVLTEARFIQFCRMSSVIFIFSPSNSSLVFHLLYQLQLPLLQQLPGPSCLPSKLYLQSEFLNFVIANCQVLSQAGVRCIALPRRSCQACSCLELGNTDIHAVFQGSSWRYLIVVVLRVVVLVALRILWDPVTCQSHSVAHADTSYPSVVEFCLHANIVALFLILRSQNL